LMSGIWKRKHGQIFRHRQPKGLETVMAEPNSTAPDLDSTLHPMDLAERSKARPIPLCRFSYGPFENAATGPIACDSGELLGLHALSYRIQLLNKLAHGFQVIIDS
jgi:hypothetical protein